MIARVSEIVFVYGYITCQRQEVTMQIKALQPIKLYALYVKQLTVLLNIYHIF